MNCPICPHAPHQGYCDACNCYYVPRPDPEPTMPEEYARSADPSTSHAPYEKHIRSWKSQSGRALLIHYENARTSTRGLNHWEANVIATQRGWSLGECYWHRVGDLAKWGYITELRNGNGEIVKRPGQFSTDLREVFVITDAGRRRARELRGEP